MIIEHKYNYKDRKKEVELAKIKYVTQAQFDFEYDIFHKITIKFHEMITVISTIQNKYLINNSNEEYPIKFQVPKISFDHCRDVFISAQDLLYENEAFIKKDLFCDFEKIYETASDLWWKIHDNCEVTKKDGLEYIKSCIGKEDKAVQDKIRNDYTIVCDKLRDYFHSLSVIR